MSKVSMTQCGDMMRRPTNCIGHLMMHELFCNTKTWAVTGVAAEIPKVDKWLHSFVELLAGAVASVKWIRLRLLARVFAQGAAVISR